MRREGFLHFVGTDLKSLQQIAMPALEVLQHVRQLACRLLRIQLENAFDDMVGASLVGGIEIARFGCQLERAHDDARRVRTQIECVSIQESGVQKRALSWPKLALDQAPTARSATGFGGLTLTRAS